jgi:hypothetical protein
MRAKYYVSPAIAPALFFFFAKNYKLNTIKNAAAYASERLIFLFHFLKLKIPCPLGSNPAGQLLTLVYILAF